MYPVSRVTGEGRAEISRAWGPGLEQDGAGRGGGGRAGQVNHTRWRYHIEKSDYAHTVVYLYAEVYRESQGDVEASNTTPHLATNTMYHASFIL